MLISLFETLSWHHCIVLFKIRYLVTLSKNFRTSSNAVGIWRSHSIGLSFHSGHKFCFYIQNASFLVTRWLPTIKRKTFKINLIDIISPLSLFLQPSIKKRAFIKTSSQSNGFSWILKKETLSSLKHQTGLVTGTWKIVIFSIKGRRFKNVKCWL